jgi:two-component system, NtrC family, sensor kinase
MTKRGGRTTKPKRRSAAKAPRIRSSSAGGSINRVAQFERERDEALEQLAATREILKVMSRSSTSADAVFRAIVESAARLCNGVFANVRLYDGHKLHVAATHNFTIEVLDRFLKSHPKMPDRSDLAGRSILTGVTVHVPDVLADPDYDHQMALSGNWRAVLSVPMMHHGKPIGMIAVSKSKPIPFSDREIDLLNTFADQAVIAIENVRLFDEVQARARDQAESLQQQTATADVLKVISRSVFDLQPVLETLVESAARLCEADNAFVYQRDAGVFRLAATYGFSADYEAFMKQQPVQPGRGTLIGRTTLEANIVHIPDALADPEYSWQESQARGGYRTMLGVPMLREGFPIGVFAMTRSTVKPFTDKQIPLLQTFADQAVIAIENVRLFNETREALERQTATADILKVIASSPSDVQPVFDSIASSANRLLGGFSSTVFLFSDGMAHLKAFTPTTRDADEVLTSAFPRPVTDVAPFQMTEAGEAVQIPDTEAPTYQLGEIARARGYRSMLFTPLMNKGTSIGFIAVTRVQTGTFADHHVQLLKTFADQAVIAIENVRLFDEVRAKTSDLTEALERQTATSEVLEVISASPGELEPVFKTMLENATRICGASFGQMNLYEDGSFRLVALYNVPAAYATSLAHTPFQPHPQGGLGTVARTRRVVHIEDIRTLPPYREGNPSVVALADLAGARSVFVVPMLKENELIGAITIYSRQVKPFTERQTELVANFANQAVIAIENSRLLNELRERTTQLSQSLDELRTAQDRLVQTEKLASLGQLTAGIAHEIKNPLNFVNNFSALSAELIDEMEEALSDVSLDSNKREELNEITQMLKSNLEKVVQHGKRADSIVKNMLQHSREGSGEHRPADINAVVDESLNLAYHGARAEKADFTITLERKFDPAVGMVDVYPQEITRALLNLISNGFYATTKRKAEAADGFEPTLSATTRNLGDKVEIRIRDNGTGIPEEVKEKIFNPFFTTKPSGEGTGLGLSMSHDIIVKQHGGSIDVETKPGLFTEFKVVLPRTSKG